MSMEEDLHSGKYLQSISKELQERIKNEPYLCLIIDMQNRVKEAYVIKELYYDNHPLYLKVSIDLLWASATTAYKWAVFQKFLNDKKLRFKNPYLKALKKVEAASDYWKSLWVCSKVKHEVCLERASQQFVLSGRFDEYSHLDGSAYVLPEFMEI